MISLTRAITVTLFSFSVEFERCSYQNKDKQQMSDEKSQQQQGLLGKHKIIRRMFHVLMNLEQISFKVEIHDPLTSQTSIAS